MMTIWFWVAAVILTLAVLSWIPGVKVLVNPVIGMITKLVEEVFKHSAGYVIWLSKLIVVSHIDLFRHLTHGRKYFDPTDDFEGDK